MRHEDNSMLIESMAQTVSPTNSLIPREPIVMMNQGVLSKLAFCGKQTKKLWFNFPEEMADCEKK